MGLSRQDEEAVVNGVKKWGLRGVFAAAAIVVASSSLVFTQDTEVKVITYLSEFDRVTEPGMSFKIPFLEKAYTHRTDIAEFRVGPKSVASKGNQTLQDVVVDFQYRVPAENVEWLHKNARDYKARIVTLGTKVANEVLGTTDTTNLAEIRTQIGVEMANALQEMVDENGMGLNIQQASLSNFDWDPAFVKSIQENAQVKNQIVRLEAELKRDEVEARRAVVEAEGKANSARATAAGEADKNRLLAEGQRDAAIAAADGEAYRVEKEGEARASAFAAEINAFGNPDTYVDYTEAKQWNGQLPTIVGGGNGQEMFIDLRSGEALKDVTPAAPAPN